MPCQKGCGKHQRIAAQCQKCSEIIADSQIPNFKIVTKNPHKPCGWPFRRYTCCMDPNVHMVDYFARFLILNRRKTLFNMLQTKIGSDDVINHITSYACHQQECEVVTFPIYGASCKILPISYLCGNRHVVLATELKIAHLAQPSRHGRIFTSRYEERICPSENMVENRPRTYKIICGHNGCCGIHYMCNECDFTTCSSRINIVKYFERTQNIDVQIGELKGTLGGCIIRSKTADPTTAIPLQRHRYKPYPGHNAFGKL